MNPHELDMHGSLACSLSWPACEPGLHSKTLMVSQSLLKLFGQLLQTSWGGFGGAMPSL